MALSSPEPGAHEQRHRVVRSIQTRAAAAGQALDVIITVVCAGIVMFLCVSTFMGVIYRYILEQPLGWPEETSRFGLVWLSLLAACRALRRGEHIALGFVVARLPKLGRAIMRQVVNLIIIGFVAGFIYEAFDYLEIVAPTKATATGISLMWPTLGLIVSFALVCCVSALEIVDAVCARITGESTSLAVAAAEGGVELLNANPLVDQPVGPEPTKDH
jgi:TRAP-type C4-dicarboxylate transport system permease small subunit